MKVRNIALIGALFIGLSNVAGAAVAQTKIYVVNEAKIMADSKLGKAMNAQLSQDATTAVDQLGLKTLQTEVQTERAALQPQTQSLTPEAINANPTLKGRVEALNKKVNELVQKSSALDQGVDQQRSVNQVRFQYVLLPAIETVAKEVGADVVLSYASTLYNKDSVDISSKVVARLDATVPTLDALKAALPQQPAQAAAPAPGGGQ
jgi:Skp family chaperone for outer membrane proteins